MTDTRQNTCVANAPHVSQDAGHDLYPTNFGAVSLSVPSRILVSTVPPAFAHENVVNDHFAVQKFEVVFQKRRLTLQSIKSKSTILLFARNSQPIHSWSVFGFLGFPLQTVCFSAINTKFSSWQYRLFLFQMTREDNVQAHDWQIRGVLTTFLTDIDDRLCCVGRYFSWILCRACPHRIISFSEKMARKQRLTSLRRFQSRDFIGKSCKSLLFSCVFLGPGSKHIKVAFCASLPSAAPSVCWTERAARRSPATFRFNC